MSLSQVQCAAIVALTPIQAFMAWNDLYRARPHQVPPPPQVNAQDLITTSVAEMILPTGERFLNAIAPLKIDHAAVVTPLCRRSHPEATAALETLIGHPLTRLAPKGKARPPSDPRIRLGMMNKDGTARAPRQKTASVASTDTRTILEVAPNPKKPGSASHDRYANYQVGDKVMDAIAKGLTAGDIKWDLERGYIRLGA